MRRIGVLTLSACALMLFATGCGPAKHRSRSGGGINPFIGAYLAQRIGHDMNEGRRLSWPDYGRALPILSLPFKLWDAWFSFGGMTMVEREYRSGLGRPCMRQEYLDLLDAAKEAGIIDQHEHKRQVLNLPNTGFVNLRTLEFMEQRYPEMKGMRWFHSDTEGGAGLTYKQLLQRIYWERDSDINPMNSGLTVAALKAKALNEDEYRQDIFWHILKRPVPWALERARDPDSLKEYIAEARYLAELRIALRRLDLKLAQEAYEADLINASERDEWQRSAERERAFVTAFLRDIETPKK